MFVVFSQGFWFVPGAFRGLWRVQGRCRCVPSDLRSVLEISGMFKGRCSEFQGFSREFQERSRRLANVGYCLDDFFFLATPVPEVFSAFRGCSGCFTAFQECSRGS